MRYAVWNNKGGVGKSLLTFVFASEYAIKNPEKRVYVIDMCPQANVSEIFLGGHPAGTNELSNLLNSQPRMTIGGYFDSRLEAPQKPTGSETKFRILVNSRNNEIPKNLYLIVGDQSLEVQAEAINQIANVKIPKATWKKVHSWLADLCDALEEKEQCLTTTIFIDCNPSFAAYTKLSIVAADKLIIPCTADGSSARAIDNIGQLVYGHGVLNQYEDAMFSSCLKQENMMPPSIKLILLNRSTQYDKKAAKAFAAMFDDIKKRARRLLSDEPAARDAQVDGHFLDIPDTHSVAIVASHLGIPISQIKARKYRVFETETQVNKITLDRYKKAIEEVIKVL